MGAANHASAAAETGSTGEVEPVIRVENVSKRFTLRAGGGKSSELRDRFGAGAKREFWALKNVNFTLQPGDTLGIVGHNGSGKSTMLKMLTGILAPTEGHINVRGRVGALIEVGAGFHPDLSGRENVYLNGSILGLTRREIDERFDRIVEFANLAEFIDTPVKRYSSGMYMRLGFAIAAHTDPDVLLIDEVLAVGDTLFQRKCLRFLKEFVAQGGAVAFVSHSMAQVAELCETCVWLDHGEARFVGPTREAIDQYMAVVTERENAELQRTHPDEWAAHEAERQREEEARAWEREQAALADAQRRSDRTQARLLGVTLRDDQQVARTGFAAGETVRIEIAYRFPAPLPNPIIGVDIFRASDDLHMFTTSNFDQQVSFRDLPLEGAYTLKIPVLHLNTGRYRIQINLFAHCATPDWNVAPLDSMPEGAYLDVQPARMPNGGCVYQPSRWDVTPGGEPFETATTPRVTQAVWEAVP